MLTRSHFDKQLSNQLHTEGVGHEFQKELPFRHLDTHSINT